MCNEGITVNLVANTAGDVDLPDLMSCWIRPKGDLDSSTIAHINARAEGQSISSHLPCASGVTKGKGVSLNCAISPGPILAYSPNNASCLASAAPARSLRGRPRAQ
jgi:hypothetical protein